MLKGKSISSVEQNKMVIGNSQDVSEINYEKGIVVKIYTPKNYIESSEINSSINMYVRMGECNNIISNVIALLTLIFM